MLLHSIVQILLVSYALAADGSPTAEVPASVDRIALAPVNPERSQAHSKKIEYRVGPKDVLGIQVFGEPNLSGNFPIRENGEIDFPLLGAIHVNGIVLAEVGERLRLELRDGFLVDPRVSVVVEKYVSRPVQILGAIKKPGIYYLEGSTSVIEMISQAGGIDKQLGATEVRILHEGQEDQAMILDMESLLERGQGNVQLRTGDTIYVPKGPMVYVDGDVEKPGPVAFRRNMTASQALAEVGGALQTANLRDAYILRDGQRISLNLKKIQKGRQPDIILKPGDQIFLQTSML
jgi:polysaccharide export outer membrane protein